MSKITAADIESSYALALREVRQLVCEGDWAIRPQGIKLSRRKRCFGLADQTGYVHINHAFIGSEAWSLLKATVRHELTHLFVGLEHGHNARFKQWAHAFGADMGPSLKQEMRQIEGRIGHKYVLWAHLSDGERIWVRHAHRRSAKYLKYKPGLFHHLSVNGQKIVRFEYEPV